MSEAITFSTGLIGPVLIFEYNLLGTSAHNYFKIRREMEKKITMKEIASIANVSKATVSRVLQSPDLVKPETRQRVLLAMEQNQYVYSVNAAELSRRSSTVIGLILPMTKDAGYTPIILAIDEMAQKKGYSIVIGNSKYDPKLERQLLRQFQERQVAGVIFAGFSLSQKKVLLDLTESGIPCVVFDELKENFVSSVGIDPHKAAFSMTEYLISLNHRRIGIIVLPRANIEGVQRRLQGYQEALKKYNILYDSKLVIVAEPSLLNGKETTERFLSMPNPPTAIFTGSDEMAIGAMSAISNRGLSIPGDISVVGFDDIEIAAYLLPPLTTIRVPNEKIGYLLAKTLFEMIEDKNTIQNRQYCLDTELIIRSSCRKLEIT